MNNTPQSAENDGTVSDPQPSNKQEPTQIEVHKPQHRITHKKKWGEYLRDFFMLFLAVFCGFLAENIRESRAEKQKEKQYIISLMRDLSYDTLRFGQTINLLNKKIPYYDSALKFLDNPKLYNNKLPFKFYIETNIEHDYSPSEPTIQQLKHSGNLRLIEKSFALDTILIYDSHISGDFKDQTNYVIELNKRLLEFQETTFDFKNFNLFLNSIITNDSAKDYAVYDQSLISNNQNVITEIANKFITAKAAEVFYIRSIERVQNEANNLIGILQREYKFKTQEFK